MSEIERQIFNYEIEEKEKCYDCKYHHWYYDDGKKYGCPSFASNKICGSFRRWMDGPETEEVSKEGMRLDSVSAL